MKAGTGAVALLASTLMLIGCYGFEAPVDPAPTLPLDPALLGTWHCLAPGQGADEKPLELAFARADGDDLYSIARREKGPAGAPLVAHASEVVGHSILNVFDPAASGKPWMLVRYSFLMPHVLRLDLVDDGPLADVEPTSWALRSALEHRDGTEGLYDDLCVCVRVAADEEADAAP